MYTNEAGRDKEIKRKREIPGFCFPTQMDYKHQTDTVCHLLLLNTGWAQSAKRWRDLETEATRWLPHLVVTDNRCSPRHRRALVLIGMCTTAMCSYSIHIGLVFIHKNPSLFICRHLDLFPLAVDIPRVITLFGTPARPNPTTNPLLRQILPFLLCFVLFTRSIPSLCRCLVSEQNFNYSSMNFYLENYNFQIFLLASFAHKFLDNS